MLSHARSHDFARNLNGLLFIRGLGRKEAAQAIGVPYKWLRRMVSQGLARCDQRSATHLERVAQFFGLTDIDALWRLDLIDLRVCASKEPPRKIAFNGSRKQLSMARMEALLDSGDFEYLHEIIESLYQRATGPRHPSGGRVHSGAGLAACERDVLVKWTGNKRDQAASILSYFPAQIETYYEPFVGGGLVLHALLSSNLRAQRIVCGDVCPALIDLWNMVKDRPDQLMSEYERLWLGQRTQGRKYYYSVRDQFNRTRGPCELLFLTRTCRFGLVRFNGLGQFTSGPDKAHWGLAPNALSPVLYDWHRKLREKDVHFACTDYRTVKSQAGDFLYLDPPYPTKTVYYGKLDYAAFFQWLEGQPAAYALSLAASPHFDLEVPCHVFDEHIEIDTGLKSIWPIVGKPCLKTSDHLYLKKQP